MEIVFWIVASVIVICLLYLRANVVIEEWKEWNYKVYRYKIYRLMGSSSENGNKIDLNVVSTGECILVIIMFWKFWPDRFFDFKPDWYEIHEKYYLKKS